MATTACFHASVHKLTCDFWLLQSLEKYLHGPMKGKNLTDEVIDQRAAELAKAHHDAQQVRLCVCVFLGALATVVCKLRLVCLSGDR